VICKSCSTKVLPHTDQFSVDAGVQYILSGFRWITLAWLNKMKLRFRRKPSPGNQSRHTMMLHGTPHRELMQCNSCPGCPDLSNWATRRNNGNRPASHLRVGPWRWLWNTARLTMSRARRRTHDGEAYDIASGPDPTNAPQLHSGQSRPRLTHVAVSVAVALGLHAAARNHGSCLLSSGPSQT
jgi:hypothetical protein